MGIVLLLLLLALFKPEPGFGASISTRTTSSFPLGMFSPDAAAVWRKSAAPNPRRTAVTPVALPLTYSCTVPSKYEFISGANIFSS
jgi:hypothetical protein